MILQANVRALALLTCVSTLTLTAASAAPPTGPTAKPQAPAKAPVAKTPASKATSVKHPTQTETLYPWVGATGPMTVAHLKKLVDWALLDPQSTVIVKTAMARFGATDLPSFLKLFTVDPPDASSEKGTRRGGQTHYGDLNSETIPIEPADQFSGADLEKMEPYQSKIQAIAKRADAYFVYTVNRSVNLRVFTFSHPYIYLTRGETLRQSFESFMHELTHFNRFDLRTEPNPLDYNSAEDFEAAYLLAPGEEADARAAGVSALIRLLQKLPDNTSLPVNLEQWFTDKGQLIASPAQQLLVIRDFLGYHAQEFYRDRLQILLMEDDDEWRALRSLPASNQQAAARIAALMPEITKANYLLSHSR